MRTKKKKHLKAMPLCPRMRKKTSKSKFSLSEQNSKLKTSSFKLKEKIAKQKFIQQRLEHLNQVLRAIRIVNQLITKEKNPNRLLKSICEALIESWGYYFTWIALLDESKRITDYFFASRNKEYLIIKKLLQSQQLPECGKKALTQSKLLVLEDVCSCPNCPAVNYGSRRGNFTSPLKYDQKIYGVISVALPQEWVLEPEEQSLFQDVCSDIAFALNRLEQEKVRKQAEKESKRIKAFLESSLTSIPEGVVLLDKEERFFYVNPVFLEWLGRSSKDFIGKTMREVFPPFMREKTTQQIAEMIKRGINSTRQVRDLEVELLGKDGNPIFVSCSAGGIKDEKGKVIGEVVFLRDITKQKQIREALLKTSQEWNATFDTISEMIMVIDSDYKIRRVNRAVTQLLGMSYQEILGKKCYQLIHKTEHPPRYCLHRQIFFEGKRASQEIFEPSLNRYFAVSFNPLFDSTGALIGSVHVMRDITEQKKLQEQLEQAIKMEAIGRLAGGVAHDFNNNLTPIFGICDLWLADMDSSHPFYQDLLEIKESAERCARLIHQLMAFSRKQVVEPKLFNLNDVINNLEKMLVRLIGEDIQLEKRLEPHLQWIKTDIGEIEQVIINLAVNARDAMPYGGKLVISTENVYLDDAFCGEHLEFQPGWYVNLTISDTGIGISKEIIDHIFEPFFTTKEKGKGTGLGLSMVYGIIKQAGGNILVESEPGKGTSFKIFLPVAKKSDSEILSPPESLAQVLQGTETILLVEDELSIRKVLKKALAGMGYQILEAGSGEEALEIVKRKPQAIHLVITDVVMTGMSGKELAEHLKTIVPHLKIIYISGYLDDLLARHGILEPDIHFVQKPIRIEALIKKIRQVLST